MDKLKRLMKWASAVLTVSVMLLAVDASTQAQATGGHDFGAGRSGGSGMHHGFDGHHDFDGHHGFDRGEHRRFGFGPVFPYYGYYPPFYSYETPGYWYYCPSYGAYYPSVATCPEAWVPVPDS